VHGSCREQKIGDEIAFYLGARLGRGEGGLGVQFMGEMAVHDWSWCQLKGGGAFKGGETVGGTGRGEELT